MCQMAGTEGMRARRVRVRARRPRVLTAAVWVCSVEGGSGFGSWMAKVDRKGVLGLLGGLLSISSSGERGMYVGCLLPRTRTAQGKRKVLLISKAALRTSAQVMSVIEKPELTRKTMRVDEKVRIEKCRVDMASEGIQTSVLKYCCRLRPYWENQPRTALRALRRLSEVKPTPSWLPLTAISLASDTSTTFSSRSCSLPCQTILAVPYSKGQVMRLRPISRIAPSRGDLVADMKAEIAIGDPSLQMRSIRLMTALRRDKSYGGCCLSVAPAVTIVGTQSRSMEIRLASRDNLSEIPSANIRRKVASFH